MSKARALAIKTLKNEEIEAYMMFLFDFLTMSLQFYAQESFDIDDLLLIHKEMEDLKAMIDKGGKILDNLSDDKLAKFAQIKYELLKMANRKKDTYEAGISSIHILYDQKRLINENYVPLFDCFQIYELTIHEFFFGDLSKSYALWN